MEQTDTRQFWQYYLLCVASEY